MPKLPVDLTFVHEQLDRVERAARMTRLLARVTACVDEQQVKSLAVVVLGYDGRATVQTCANYADAVELLGGINVAQEAVLRSIVPRLDADRLDADGLDAPGLDADRLDADRLDADRSDGVEC